MILAFILLVVVIVVVFYWKVQFARSRCIDTSLYCRRVNVRDKIRIAIITKDAIALRPYIDADMKEKWDLTLESFVGSGETVEEALLRMLSPLGNVPVEDVRFCLRHKSNYVKGRGSVYLFVVNCFNKDSNVWVHGDDYFLWSFDDVSSKLGQDVFSEKFEEEYPHINFIVETWKCVMEEKASCLGGGV